MDALQILGYAASIVIFISLTMKSLAKLRIINAIGSLLFVIFALKTNSLPTVALNAGLVIIDMYYFFRMMRTKDNFDIMEVRKDNEIITRFCEKHQGELDAIFGSEALDACTNFAAYFRNDDIAGIVGYAQEFDGTSRAAKLFIDFVVPKYRDFAIGRYFFVKDVRFWQRQDIERITVASPSAGHVPYLKQLGFTEDKEAALWFKTIQ